MGLSNKHWIERSARRRSAESNIRTALKLIEDARLTGGSRTCGSPSDYREALYILHIAVRDLSVSDGTRER